MDRCRRIGWRRTRMKRRAATQEIANIVRYFAGDGASYVTGQTKIAAIVCSQ